MKNGKLQVGIIGCGGIANQKHLPSLQASSDLCDIVAFCDLIPERAEKAAKEYGVPGSKVYTDYHELLKEGAIDAVHILTPNVSHSPITVAAFGAGKHVMCEKPMAHTTEAARLMIDAWKKSGRKFTVGYQNRFKAEVQSLHKSCANGELGEIYYAKASAIRRRAVPTWGVFQDKAQQGGGPLIDIGTHALDLTLWMMNNYEPVSVSGAAFYKMAGQTQGNMFGPWDPKTYDVEDSSMGLIRMKNGAVVYLEASWVLNVTSPREIGLTLCGTKAGAEADVIKREIIYNREHSGLLTEEHLSPGSTVNYFSGAQTTPGSLEARQWLQAILNGAEPLVDPEQAFVVTKILDAIYRSAESGKEVHLD